MIDDFANGFVPEEIFNEELSREDLNTDEKEVKVESPKKK